MYQETIIYTHINLILTNVKIADNESEDPTRSEIHLLNQ